MSRPLSIRRRLTIRLLGGVLMVSAATVAVTYLYLRQEIVEQYDAALLAKARTLSDLVTVGADGQPSFLFTEGLAPEYQQGQPEGDYFQLWKSDGAMLAQSPSMAGENLPKLDSHPQVDGATFEDASLPGGRSGRIVWVRFHPAVDTHAGQATPSPAILLAVGTPGDEFDETMRHLLIVLVCAGVAITTGTILVVFIVVKQGLAPLQRLADEAQQIDSTSLDLRFEEAGVPIELHPISSRLNELMARLDAAFNRERRFTSNVAHELRTPIAELRATAEVALRWPDDPELTAKACQGALAISKQMEAVVTALLNLVRGEADRQPVDLTTLDLRRIVLESWKPHEALARERGVITNLQLEDDNFVRSDATLLSSMLGNLFANAVAYTPPGGSITCQLEARPTQIAVVLSNSATHLAQEDMSRLTEPFWRKDTARSDRNHVGLGLSIVQTYAAVLDASVEFSLREDRFSARVHLPRHGSRSQATPVSVSDAQIASSESMHQQRSVERASTAR